jgi:lysophospholipase L1-like esterase
VSGPRTLLCYGDSNTHGTMPMARLMDMGRYGPEARWPGVLQADLGSGWRVIEEGLPGRTTVHPDPISGVHKNGLAVLPAVLESHRPLDLVVLMLGTNDLKHRFGVPAVEIAVSVEHLVLATLRSGTGPGAAAPAVLLVAPPPVLEAGCLAEVFEGGAAKSARLAGFCAEVAMRHGIGFLDAGQHIESSPLDGVHFDAEAHFALGRAVAGTVRALFPAA